MDINRLLKLMVDKKASDLFITAGFPPSMKINGRLVTVNKTPITPALAEEMVHSVMNESQQAQFEAEQECNFAVSASGVGRFRVSAFSQRNLAGMVLRRIEVNIPDISSLGLPEVVKKTGDGEAGFGNFCRRNRGG